MTEIKVLELMDAIQQTQKNTDDMWRVLREVLEEQHNAQQSVQRTCATCGASLNFVGYGRYQCPNHCLVIGASR